MQKCPHCGQNNPDDLSRCIKCKMKLKIFSPKDTSKAKSAERIKYIIVMVASFLVMAITFALSELVPTLNSVNVVRYLMISILVISGIFFALGALHFFNSRKS